MRVSEINESTNPECFFFENETTPGVYDVPSRTITGLIDPEPLLTVIKKCFDGIMSFSILTDRMEIHWRRDIDVAPIKVADMRLTAQVYHNTSWISQPVGFDYITDPDITATVVDAGAHYRVFQYIAALGTDNHLGVDWQFTKGIVDFKFLIFSAGKPVRCQLDTYIREAALRTLRADNRGLMEPGEFDGAVPTMTPDTPTAGWRKYQHIWERTNPCEAVDGRTPVELFVQDAGLSVR